MSVRQEGKDMEHVAIANFAYVGKTYYIGDDAPGDEALFRLNLIEAKKIEVEVEVDASESIHEGDED